jgi:exopolysaccharide production protein ExoY
MNEERLLVVGAAVGHGGPVVSSPMPVVADRRPVASTEAYRDGWAGKRLVDVVVSLVLLLLTLPLFLAIALVIRMTSDGPALFRQTRVGRGGREFRMLKFRSMRADSEELLRADPELYELFLRSSHKLPTAIDPRITAVGRLLRRLSFDELPQLINVLLGHMSLVGPRPVERSQLELDYRDHQSAYTALRPGLTGLWQVSGRSTVQFPERAELDSRYVETCGPWTDAKIMLRTPVVVFTGLGAD